MMLYVEDFITTVLVIDILLINIVIAMLLFSEFHK